MYLVRDTQAGIFYSAIFVVVQTLFQWEIRELLVLIIVEQMKFSPLSPPSVVFSHDHKLRASVTFQSGRRFTRLRRGNVILLYFTVERYGKEKSRVFLTCSRSVQPSREETCWEIWGHPRLHISKCENEKCVEYDKALGVSESLN